MMGTLSTSSLTAIVALLMIALLMTCTSAEDSLYIDVVPSSYCFGNSLSSVASCKSLPSGQSSNKAIQLFSGKHILNTGLTIKNATNFEMYTSPNDSASTAVVICQEAGTITLENISNVHIRDVVFIGCTGIQIVLVDKLILENCHFRGPAKRAESAVTLRQVSLAQVIDSSFTSYDQVKKGVLSIYSSSNIIITKSKFQSNVAAQEGGGIYVKNSTNIKIDDSTFSQNSARQWHGGCMYVDTSHVIIRQSTFAENTAEFHGGCLYIRDSNIVIADSTFRSNTVMEYHGGAMYAYRSTINIDDCVFSRNKAHQWHGGAIYTYRYNNITISGTTFRENTAKYYGGGLHVYYHSVASVQESTFIENTGRYGGGAYLYYYNDVHIKGSAFIRNVANGNYFGGGGLYMYYYSNITIDGCTFRENTAHDDGGGVHAYYNTNVSITDSSFTMNNALDDGRCLYTRLNNNTIIDATSRNSLSKDPGCHYNG